MDLKVLLYSLWYPPYVWGGVGTQTFDLANSLAKLGAKVTVICGGPSMPTDLSENLEVVRLPTIEAQPRFLWFQLRNKNSSVLLDKLKHADVLHSQATALSMYPLLYKKRSQPWIVSMHVSSLEEAKILLTAPPLNLNLEDIITHVVAFPVWTGFNYLELKYSDRCIICGYAAAKNISDLFNYDLSKLVVIQNGIDFSKIRRIVHNSDFTNCDERPTIFYCGRLYWRKGIEYLIKAMPYVINEHKNVLLKIFGKGPLKSKLLRLIHSLHLENNVELVGYASYEHLIQQLDAASIAVFPSLYEGLSVAMLEAMACSKPIVAFNYPFTREIIEHMKTGILVPPKDITKLSKAISFLLSDEELRKDMGNSAYKHVEKNYDWSIIAKKYVETYKEAIENFSYPPLRNVE